MPLPDRLMEALAGLGTFLDQFAPVSEEKEPDHVVVTTGPQELNLHHFRPFSDMVEKEQFHNPWFTPENVRRALGAIAGMLRKEILQRWLEPYGLEVYPEGETRTVGLVTAGNIPLVGFHDLMSVLVTGYSVLVKPSSKDDRLIRKLGELLAELEPSLKGRIRFTDDRLTGIDAVIATGSDNSARHFEYYFREIPHVIRRNRSGVAVLTGRESDEELEDMGRDIFTYFGLGCRNVTKLYIPAPYDLKRFLGIMDRFHQLAQHHKYGNNVEYNRTIYLMNRVDFLDNGFLLMKEDPAISSPVGVVYYERYSEIRQVAEQLKIREKEIQCTVSVHPELPDAIPPGTTQDPMPWDYADGIDTIQFLKEL